MEIKLDNNLYAFSVAEGHKAVVTVLSGELDYSPQSSGPFRSELSLSEGQTHEFTVPGLLAAHETAEFELDYPQPDPPPEEIPSDEGSANGNGSEAP